MTASDAARFDVPDDVLTADGRVRDPELVHDTDFLLGDLVVDIDTCQTREGADGEVVRPGEDTGVAIVVRAGRATAADHVLKDGQTVADVNPDYPATDPLVSVVFVETLDRTVSEWRDRWERHTLDWRIDDFKDEWGVPIKTYSYPESRLIRAAEAGIDEQAVMEPDWEGV